MACKPDISIVCIWPDYPVESGGGTRTGGSMASEHENGYPPGGSGGSTDGEGDLYLRLGHAGILLIKGGTGPATAHYYEFGRYLGPNPTNFGNVRDYAVTNIVLDDNGWPTESSLHAAARFITGRSGRNTYMHGNVSDKCGGTAYDNAVAFAEAFSQEYTIVTNSCMIFAHKVNHAGGWTWFGPVPVWNSNPKRELENGFFSNHITYDPDGDDFNENVWQIPGW